MMWSSMMSTALALKALASWIRPMRSVLVCVATLIIIRSRCTMPFDGVATATITTEVTSWSCFLIWRARMRVSGDERPRGERRRGWGWAHVVQLGLVRLYHDRHARELRHLRAADNQAVDVEAARCEERGNTRQHARVVHDERADDVSVRVAVRAVQSATAALRYGRAPERVPRHLRRHDPRAEQRSNASGAQPKPGPEHLSPAGAALGSHPLSPTTLPALLPFHSYSTLQSFKQIATRNRTQRRIVCVQPRVDEPAEKKQET